MPSSAYETYMLPVGHHNSAPQTHGGEGKVKV